MTARIAKSILHSTLLTPGRQQVVSKSSWQIRQLLCSEGFVRKMATRKSVDTRVSFKTGEPPTSKIPVSVRKSFNSQTNKDVDTTDSLQLAKAIFFGGLENVKPEKLIKSKVRLEGSILKLENEEETSIDLSQYEKKYIVGFGKACLPMAENLLLLLQGKINRCVVSVPVDFRQSRNADIEVYPGGEHNIPDEASLIAATEIVDVAKSCTNKDLLIVLITGGGSALLPMPIPPVTLDEKQELIKHLAKAGCTINELNTVRKRLSLVKGGGLVRLCNAKKIVSLIISDVAGNPLDIIASGTTVEDVDPPDAALKILEKFNLDEELPPSINEVLRKLPPAISHFKFDHVTNFIIGDNRLALEAAAATAANYGIHPIIVTTTMSGEASEVGYDMASLAEAIAYCITHKEADNSNVKAYMDTITRIFKHNKWPLSGTMSEILQINEMPVKGVCLLFGGETTVTVRGNGIGGRNQELILSAGTRLDISRNLPHVKNKVAILSAGSDGIDGFK
ncbi:unnamed protein product [Orchesella dallaii]|uniref:Glycerate kinase n=1 Tax=Orchesella dallaii TaxID=48710 RepID=A0ABP1RF40_9HEXA